MKARLIFLAVALCLIAFYAQAFFKFHPWSGVTWGDGH
jgi:hypothetical protein